MFRIKICGVTTVADAQLVARSKADAIGLNFYGKSPRYVSIETAEQIVDALPPSLKKVGVFVNASAELIRQYHETLGLDFVQLHGDETPEFLQQLGGFNVIKVFRPKAGFEEITQFLHACQTGQCLPDLVLIDAYHLAAYGGTGETVDWSALTQARSQFMGIPLILAGGLTPQNVAAAIAQVQPQGVDTASGVEQSPGVKSAPLVANFAAAAQLAFEQIEATR